MLLHTLYLVITAFCSTTSPTPVETQQNKPPVRLDELEPTKSLLPLIWQAHDESKAHEDYADEKLKTALDQKDGHDSFYYFFHMWPFRAPTPKYVIFRDDFDLFDYSKWSHDVSMYGGYSKQFQVYTDDPRNSFTRNGYLYIMPTFTESDPLLGSIFRNRGVMDMKKLYGVCTSNFDNGCVRDGKTHSLQPTMSARLNSAASIRFGEVEVRARISKGDWLFPAIWLRSRHHKYGKWPRSGEIDIMESRGNQAKYFGVGTCLSTLHWGPDKDQDMQNLTRGHAKMTSWADAFHTWILRWTPDSIHVSVDGKTVMHVEADGGFWEKGGFEDTDNIWAGGSKMAPFDEEFYLILNVAVGGTGGMFKNNKIDKPWDNDSPNVIDQFWSARHQWEKTWVGDDVAMIIDYVEMRHI